MKEHKFYQLNLYSDRELQQLGGYPSREATAVSTLGKKVLTVTQRNTGRLAERLSSFVDQAVQRWVKSSNT